MTAVPDYLRRIAERARELTAEEISRWNVPAEGGRESAVLILIGDSADGPDVLLTQKSARLRNHAGQPAFPGGGAEPGDADPAATALREAAEEVALDPSGVVVFGELPALYLAPSRYLVTPVLAYWHTPGPVWVNDPREVASVARIPLATLADPANRFTVRHPSGYTGGAFEVGGMAVWGFTAGLLRVLLELGGWARPWETGEIREMVEDIDGVVGVRSRL